MLENFSVVNGNFEKCDRRRLNEKLGRSFPRIRKDLLLFLLKALGRLVLKFAHVNNRFYAFLGENVW